MSGIQLKGGAIMSPKKPRTRPASATGHKQQFRVPPTADAAPAVAAPAAAGAGPLPSHLNRAFEEAPPPDLTDQRNAKGRFAKGHAGAPGRPRRAVELQYLAAL